MESVASTALGQGGFMTALAERVNSDEAFMLIAMAFMAVFMVLAGLGLWKVWGEFKHIIKDREHTAEKRNAEIMNLQNQYTRLEGMIASHFQLHLGTDKSLETNTHELNEIRERLARFEAKLDLLLELRIPKPRLPK